MVSSSLATGDELPPLIVPRCATSAGEPRQSARRPLVTSVVRRAPPCYLVDGDSATRSDRDYAVMKEHGRADPSARATFLVDLRSLERGSGDCSAVGAGERVR